MTTATPTRPVGQTDFVSWREFLTSPYAASLALVCLAVWLHAADSLIVATMMPSMVAEIGGAHLVGWNVSLYGTASLVAGAASALLTMRFGLRAPMSLAAVMFGLGCLLSALAPSMPVVLAGRLFQGLGGGGLVSMSFVAVSVIFPSRYTARAIATVSTCWGMSAFLGPLVGSIFVEYATWRWGMAFFGLQAFGLAAWIVLRGAARQTTEHQPSDTGRGFPLLRLALLSLAVVAVSYASVRIELFVTSGCVVLGLASLALFLWLDEQAGKQRLLPRRAFDMRRPTGAALTMNLLLSLATVAISSFMPLLISQIHGASALTIGYVVACASISWTLMAILVSGSPERRDSTLITIGVLMIVASVIGFYYALPRGPVWLIALCSALDGAGFGMAWTFLLRRTTALADPKDRERIAGAFPTVQRLGIALGAAYVAIVANASGFATMQTVAEASHVARVVYAACLPVALLGLLSMIQLVRPQPETLG